MIALLEFKGATYKIASLKHLAAVWFDRYSRKKRTDLQCSEGTWSKLDPAAAEAPMSFDDDCAKLLSMSIFLQMSLRALATARAGTSHRNTWHLKWKQKYMLTSTAYCSKRSKGQGKGGGVRSGH